MVVSDAATVKVRGRKTEMVEDVRPAIDSYGTALKASLALGRLFTKITEPDEVVGVLLPNVGPGIYTLLGLWANPPDASSHGAVQFAVHTHLGLFVFGMLAQEVGAAYPSLSEIFPAALRLERAGYDLAGVRSTAMDQRPWLRHDGWREDEPPLRGTMTANESSRPHYDYPFVRVTGDGVHEIPVGPVHAGVIEPGHFRFSVVAEKVLRLEQRLGYVHKGIEWRFTQLPILMGQRLAARISGDSAVAYSWAYCQALEGMGQVCVPERALWLRGMCLEIERLANHLGDLGALGNDAGFAFGQTQFQRLKELLLRAGEAAFGQRYLFDVVVPGGIARDPRGAALDDLYQCVAMINAQVATLHGIYDEHPGVRDRFSGAGYVAPSLAARLGLIGLAGRASGQRLDMRIALPVFPYSELQLIAAVSNVGDVAARVAMRFDEVEDSCMLLAQMAQHIAPGAVRADVPIPPVDTLGVGVIEGWRGPVLVSLLAGADGAIARCHPQDPSWHNWPVLEHAVIGNIVPDFPLINKSFNLSYSGADL